MTSSTLTRRSLAIIAALGLSLGAGSSPSQQPATQTITIRMLHGKSGKPLSNKNVTLAWSPDFIPWHGTVVHLGKDGTGTADVPAGVELFEVMPGPKVGKEPGRIPYFDCNSPLFPHVSVSQVLKKGVVSENTCSNKTAIPRPGEIVYWAKPLPWWQPDMQ